MELSIHRNLEGGRRQLHEYGIHSGGCKNWFTIHTCNIYMSCSTQGVKDVYSLLNLCPYGFLSLLSNYLEPLIFNRTHGFSYLKWNNYGSKPQFVTNMYNNHTSLCQYEIVTRWIVCVFIIGKELFSFYKLKDQKKYEIDNYFAVFI